MTETSTYPIGGSPAPPAAGPARRSRGRQLSGGLIAAGAAAAKYGTLILKVGKLGPTFISMVLSLGVLALAFGPAFGAGLLALIAVHEYGHLLFARREGIRASAPIFLGPLGAVIGLRQPLKNARQEAVIAIGGPVVGTAGAVACALLAGALGAGYLHRLLLALAYVGFWLNLFNLIPVTPLDGGRVVSALSRWANLVGLALVAALLVVPALLGVAPNPFLVLILLLGGLGTWQRFRQARLNPEYLAVAPGVRVRIGLAYAAMLAITALGMSLTHAAIG
jgi:Zn-dependent protease